MTTMDLPPMPRTGRPCPPWCTLPTGHGFESISLTGEPPEAIRYHGVTIGQVFDEKGFEVCTVQLDQEEGVERVAGGRDGDGEVLVELVGPSRFGPLTVDVGEVAPMTPEAARQLAAALLNAADDAEAYGAGERP